MLLLLAGLMASTLLSEDASLLSAAALSRADAVPAWAATTAVAFGIWLGDLGLFFAGQVAGARGAVARRWVRRPSGDDLDAARRRLRRGVLIPVLISRAIPGSRVPLYVAAGALGVRWPVFAAATGLAVTVWCPIIVMGLVWRP
jgi:membrane protein DedA with SNARE-associated domain